MEPLRVSREEARRFLIAYHHLSDATALDGPEDIPAFVRKMGCVQFDPLDQVGRNPDLVLQARLPGYRRGDIDRFLYEDRHLVDGWDKNMAIYHVEDWPCFGRERAFMAAKAAVIGDYLEQARRYLRDNDYVNSSDLPFDEKVHWHWGHNRAAKAALEALGYMGEAVVHHKRGTRRYYALAERCLPEAVLNAPDPNPTDADYSAWYVGRRIGGVGLLWNRGGDAFLGIRNFKSEDRNRGFEILLERDAIRPVAVEGIGRPLYLLTDYVELLRSSRNTPVPSDNVRFIAPLDSFIWERRLLSELFDFDYKWEVYVPEPLRKYGYYVLPILAGERFVGRIELATDRKEQALVVKNIWWEPDVKPKRPYVAPVRAALRRFAKYNLCKTVRYDVKL